MSGGFLPCPTPRGLPAKDLDQIFVARAAAFIADGAHRVIARRGPRTHLAEGAQGRKPGVRHVSTLEKAVGQEFMMENGDGCRVPADQTTSPRGMPNIVFPYLSGCGSRRGARESLEEAFSLCLTRQGHFHKQPAQGKDDGGQ